MFNLLIHIRIVSNVKEHGESNIKKMKIELNQNVALYVK